MDELDGGRVPQRVERVVQAEVDGDLVLMSPKDFGYFGTQGTGDLVWSLIDGRRSIDAIVADLESRYSAEPGVIAAQTTEFISALISAGLVRLA